MPPPVVKIIGDQSIAYCAEEWGEYEKGRLVYSCFSLVVQVRSNFIELLSDRVKRPLKLS
jgi:hypothetical protein